MALEGGLTPSRPLPENYHDLCPYFDLDMAEEFARDFRIPHMTQVVFYAMGVNNVLELGVMNTDLAEHLKSSLEGMWWHICEVMLRACWPLSGAKRSFKDTDRPLALGGESFLLLPACLYKDRVGFIMRGHLIMLQNPFIERSGLYREKDSALSFIMVFPPFRAAEYMVGHVKKTFKQHMRAASRPPRPLPENYQDFCPGFTLIVVDEAAYDFGIPKIIQATFYAMVVNDTVELGVISKDMDEALKSTLKDLWWIIFES
ncbi:hypothetical protein Cgig2_025519 [Carnegiea gigantea]|uniref:Uncharacterized protein n=1 Tax=Carnegiea gigantea TaxID=171969 RepID=A0A9Q1K558_9CARY|nr:hypothetical protein Cgig2_025519 [Carnegiea gigantea]